ATLPVVVRKARIVALPVPWGGTCKAGIAPDLQGTNTPAPHPTRQEAQCPAHVSCSPSPSSFSRYFPPLRLHRDRRMSTAHGGHPASRRQIPVPNGSGARHPWPNSPPCAQKTRSTQRNQLPL